MFVFFFSRFFVFFVISNLIYFVVVFFKDDREVGLEEDSESDCDVELSSSSVLV